MASALVQALPPLQAPPGAAEKQRQSQEGHGACDQKHRQEQGLPAEVGAEVCELLGEEVFRGLKHAGPHVELLEGALIVRMRVLQTACSERHIVSHGREEKINGWASGECGGIGSVLEFRGGFIAGQSKWPTSGFWAVGAMAGLWGLDVCLGAGSSVYQTDGCKD